jgi:hypothetical protein
MYGVAAHRMTSTPAPLLQLTQTCLSQCCMQLGQLFTTRLLPVPTIGHQYLTLVGTQETEQSTKPPNKGEQPAVEIVQSHNSVHPLWCTPPLHILKDKTTASQQHKSTLGLPGWDTVHVHLV